jgi:hypothetical protein
MTKSPCDVDETMTIDTLDDASALRLLGRYVTGTMEAASAPGDAAPSPSTSELQVLLREAVPPGPMDAAREPSEGELAREALKLLSQDAEAARRLAQLHFAPAQMFVEPVTFVMTGAMALSVLQLAGYVSYDKVNGWRFRLEKKAASKSLLLAFVNKVLAKLGAGT